MHKISLSDATMHLKSAKAIRVDSDVIPHFFPHPDDFGDVFMIIEHPCDEYGIGIGFEESRNRQVVVRSKDPLTFILIGDDGKEHTIMPLTTMSL